MLSFIQLWKPALPCACSFSQPSALCACGCVCCLQVTKDLGLLAVARAKLARVAAEGYLPAGQPRTVAQAALSLARASGSEPTIDLVVLISMLTCSTGSSPSSVSSPRQTLLAVAALGPGVGS